MAVRGFLLLAAYFLTREADRPSGPVVHLLELRRDQVLAGQPEVDQQTVGHVDGGVGTHHDADNQCQGKAADTLATEPVERQQDQQGRDRRRQGPRQGLGGRDVDHMLQFGIAHEPQILTYPVEYHDGVVQRITDDRQHRRQHRQVERQAQQGEEAQHEDHVMQQRRYGSYRELELETQADVHQDPGYGQQHAQSTLIAQLFTHLRTDELHTLDPHLAAVLLLDHPGDLVTHFRIVAGEANDDVGAGAE